MEEYTVKADKEEKKKKLFTPTPYQQLPEKLRAEPYKFICNYYEEIYPHIGKKVFSILSLVPVSLLLPKIPRGSKQVKSKLNVLLISSPGTGKSSIGDEFEKIAFEPMAMESVTDARLAHEMASKTHVSLIVSDIARIFSNQDLVKQLENLLGEEGCISRHTMKSKDDKKRKIEAVSFLAGTPENINSKRVRDGILSRLSPLVVFYSSDEHEAIIDQVNDEMGVEKENCVNQIRSFYYWLYSIQKGFDKKIKPVNKYVFDNQIKNEAKPFIKKIVSPIFDNYGITSIREVEQLYRFMIAHCFMNIHNRKCVKGVLHIERKDFEIAKELIMREIKTKYKIISCINHFAKGVTKTEQELRRWIERQNQEGKIRVAKDAEFLLMSMARK